MNKQFRTKSLLRHWARLAGKTVIAAGILASALLSLGNSHAETTMNTSPIANPHLRQQSSVTAQLQQFKVSKQTQGTDKLTPVSSVKPGDVIEYRATYHNHDTHPISDMVATIPIPVGMNFIPSSLTPETVIVQAATQDGVFSDIPLMHSVRQANGTIKNQLVDVADYRAIRWKLGKLSANKSMTVSMRAQVAGTPPLILQNANAAISAVNSLATLH